MKPQGLLLVMTHPPAGFDEEFNAWYDTEHVPERLAVPGFLAALRYRMRDAQRRYLALYDLDDIDVLDSPAYRAVSGENFTPWTKRVVARGRFIRVPCTQLHPGRATTFTGAPLRLLRFRSCDRGTATGIVSASAAILSGPHLRQLRVFASETSTDPYRADLYVIAEGQEESLPAAIAPEAFGKAAADIDFVASYDPYIIMSDEEV